jgi:hypothetical protein
MHDVTRLRRQAKAAYEVSRLRLALRVAALIVPLAALCARETGALLACAGIGTGLLAVSVALRWWRTQGADAVRAGLHVGVLPMAAALGVCRFAPHWPAHAAATACATSGLLAGLIAGYLLTQPERRRASHWLAVGLVACGTAALGCVGLGLSTAVGGLLGVMGGTAAMSRIRPRTSAADAASRATRRPRA